MQVACGECVGCCTSSYFIQVRAQEKTALSRIDPMHLFASPDDPRNQLMRHDEQGHCPMFKQGRCSIYEDRPDTCRTYDCRVFAAAGINAGKDKPVINERIASWRFEYGGEMDRAEHRAVSAAAAFIRQHPIDFPGGRVPSRPSEVAVIAIKAYRVFLRAQVCDADTAAAIVAACKEFDAGGHEEH